MTALMPEDSKTQTEEIVVRFKTTRPRGLLLATSLENSPDRLQIYLEDGKAKMLIHVGDKEKVSQFEQTMRRYFNISIVSIAIERWGLASLDFV